MNLHMPANKLFLARYTLLVSRYMNGSEYEEGQRLVWADSYEQAKEKLLKAVEVNDPYAISKTVYTSDIEEAIV